MGDRTLVIECRVCGQERAFAMDDMTTVRSATREFGAQHYACADGAPLTVVLSGAEHASDPLRPLAVIDIPGSRAV